ncbi:MAG: outer membrane lipoprotein-sorting protein [Bradymonadaceae bacterium]
MRNSITRIGLFFVFLLLPAVAWAESSPDAASIMEKVDGALTMAEDFTATLELETTSASGATEGRTMTVWQKGKYQRMVKLTAPARLRGVGLLASGEDQLYVYLPAFGRVRRVAGRQRGEPFLGSNFTQDDFSRTVFSDRFRPAFVEENPTHWTLRLTPKEAGSEPYDHLLLEIRKEDHQVTQILFFEEDSKKPTRRLTATDFRLIDTQMLAYTIVAEDLKSQSRSVMTLSDVKVNTGIKDSVFTQRQLQR